MPSIFDKKKAALLLEESKAFDVSVYETSSLSSEFDLIFVCSSQSAVHSRSIANRIKKFIKDNGNQENLTLEGWKVGNWISIASGKVVFHIFIQEFRDYYDIDSFIKEVFSKDF